MLTGKILSTYDGLTCFQTYLSWHLPWRLTSCNWSHMVGVCLKKAKVSYSASCTATGNALFMFPGGSWLLLLSTRFIIRPSSDHELLKSSAFPLIHIQYSMAISALYQCVSLPCGERKVGGGFEKTLPKISNLYKCPVLSLDKLTTIHNPIRLLFSQHFNLHTIKRKSHPSNQECWNPSLFSWSVLSSSYLLKI